MIMMMMGTSIILAGFSFEFLGGAKQGQVYAVDEDNNPQLTARLDPTSYPPWP